MVGSTTYGLIQNLLLPAAQTSIFLTVVGFTIYGLIRNLLVPDAPTSKSLNELIKILKGHYDPVPWEIAEPITLQNCKKNREILQLWTLFRHDAMG